MNCESKTTELGRSNAEVLVFYRQRLLVTIFTTIITDNRIVCIQVTILHENIKQIKDI